MTEQAPLSYIADYYRSVQRKNERFPEVAAFWRGGLCHVTGDHVINLGCGPMFYDNLRHFGAVPKKYVGLDLNVNSFRFLEESDDPDLVRARTEARNQNIEMDFIAGDVFAEAGKLTNIFDTALGVGFFGTFDPDPLDQLIAATKNMLRANGRVVKLTWHGAQRTEAENALKLQYSYDNELEPPAEQLVRQFEAAGLVTKINEIYRCPPGTVGWESIQLSMFQKI